MNFSPEKKGAGDSLKILKVFDWVFIFLPSVMPTLSFLVIPAGSWQGSIFMFQTTSLYKDLQRKVNYSDQSGMWEGGWGYNIEGSGIQKKNVFLVPADMTEWGWIVDTTDGDKI